MFATPAAAGLVVDHVDASQLARAGLLRIFVDLDDDAGMPQAPATAKVLIDDKAAGAVTIKPVSAVGEPVAVGVVVACHRSLNGPPDPDQGLTVNPSAKLLDGVAAGLATLGPADKSFVLAYSEREAVVLKDWAGAHQALAGVKPLPVGEPSRAPAFYDALDRALDAFASAGATLPRRKVLIVATDGMNNTEKRVDARVRAVVERASELGVRIVGIGFTLAFEEPLVLVEQMAAQTGGRYVRVPFDRQHELDNVAAAAVRRLAMQHVLEVTTAVRGKLVSLRVEAAAKGGATERRTVEVSLPAR